MSLSTDGVHGRAASLWHNLDMHDFRIFLQTDNLTGADPEISERGGQKPNSRKGGGGAEFDFLVRLSVIFL